MSINREYLQETFEVLNDEMKENNIYANIFLIGGSAGALLLKDKFRSTLDIDVIIESVTNMETFQDLIENYGIESVTVVELPPVEEIESKEKIELSNLTVSIPTIEYFALTKIFSDRSKDEYDLIHERIIESCDKEKLAAMIKEYQSFMLNENNPNMNVNTLKEYFKENGINI